MPTKMIAIKQWYGGATLFLAVATDEGRNASLFHTPSGFCLWSEIVTVVCSICFARKTRDHSSEPSPPKNNESFSVSVEKCQNMSARLSKECDSVPDAVCFMATPSATASSWGFGSKASTSTEHHHGPSVVAELPPDTFLCRRHTVDKKSCSSSMPITQKIETPHVFFYSWTATARIFSLNQVI